MGRKVHPYGFRLGYIKDWKARWYAEGANTPICLSEDLEVRKHDPRRAGTCWHLEHRD